MAKLAFVDSARTGEAAYPRRYGRDFWDDLAADPTLRPSFDTTMTRRFRVQAPQIAGRFEWHRFRTVADVGRAT
jgi:hypothetical protein